MANKQDKPQQRPGLVAPGEFWHEFWDGLTFVCFSLFPPQSLLHASCVTSLQQPDTGWAVVSMHLLPDGPFPRVGVRAGGMYGGVGDGGGPAAHWSLVKGSEGARE